MATRLGIKSLAPRLIGSISSHSSKSGLLQLTACSQNTAVCSYTTSPREHRANSKYKVLVIGGGSGGCAIAAKFKGLGKQLAVVEPNSMHYYQPIWTLVGAGIKGFQSSVKPMRDVLPSAVDWIKDKAVNFDPDNNCVTLASGEKVEYEYLVTALGIQLDYDKIKGVQDALENDPYVVSNYHPKYVLKTFPAIQEFKGGKALFTFPNTPIKCAGAPQKIMYLADEFFRKTEVRDKTDVIFNTAQGFIFGIKIYADALLKVVEKRGIIVNYKHNLTEVDHRKKTATFIKLEDNKPVEFKYDFIHVTPPMSVPDCLKESKLVKDGWVDVNKYTLQHTKYPNVFALGDCSSLPTSKTAAAVATQCGILQKNLEAVMQGKIATPLYDGYTSCPLITSSKTCILAEFDYEGKPLETFPFNQARELKLAYEVKAHVMPEIYWSIMMRGMWNGPKMVRKAMHLGMGRKPKLSD